MVAAPCGNSSVYCPAGSVEPVIAIAGYYTDVAQAATKNTSLMSRLVVCPPGMYCSGGVATPCPAGTYQPDFEMSTPAACIDCEAGWFCGAFSN